MQVFYAKVPVEFYTKVPAALWKNPGEGTGESGGLGDFPSRKRR